MEQDERAALMADLRRYKELLSGTLDPAKIAGLEHVIDRLEAKLAFMNRSSLPNTSSAP
jgi:hypothetical protein